MIAVIREAGNRAEGARRRALIMILWRPCLRIGEELDVAEADSMCRAAGSWCVVAMGALDRSG